MVMPITGWSRREPLHLSHFGSGSSPAVGMSSRSLKLAIYLGDADQTARLAGVIVNGAPQT